MAGIAAFSLLDLVTVLSTSGANFDLPAMFRRLAGQYVVDLPLAADDIAALAADHQWVPGPAHTALARPAGPPYVLAALTTELRQRSVPNPEQAAQHLLPGVGLP
jgi:hypothetical protein